MIGNTETARRNVVLAGATLAMASAIGSSATSAVRAETSSLNPQPLPPSPEWARAMPAAPDARVKITEDYARHVGKDAYFWAWPLVNMYNRRLHFMQVRETVRQGPLMEAPANRLVMLTDYVDPEERAVACPNQDVVYGIGALTIYVQVEAPTDPAQRANWLPAPSGDFSLYVRAYWPRAEIMEGSWTPPAVVKAG
jgi:hypothetical protein